MKLPVLITGAGTGIGRAIAERLGEAGFPLILMGRRQEPLEETCSTLGNNSGHRIVTCDVRDRAAVDTALASCQIESLHAVVVNAGIGGENHPGKGDRWQEIIDTNLTGSYHTAHACLPFLKQKQEKEFRHIVFISSILARLGVPGYSAYCASKAGMLGLMRSLSQELAPLNILVNALCPGWVNTDMAHDGIEAFAEALGISKEEAFEQAMQPVPLGKMSDPDEVARLTAFLVSGQQTSITGQTLDINNGAMMP